MKHKKKFKPTLKFKDEVFKKVKIKPYDNYMISNYGRLFNTKNGIYLKPYKVNQYSNLVYYKLENSPNITQIGAHKLTALHFDRMKETDETAFHLNYVQNDNRDVNLKGGRRGEAISRTMIMNQIKKSRERGVYKHPNGWRVMFSIGQMKVHTFGYYKTKAEAKEYFKIYYEMVHGVKPL